MSISPARAAAFEILMRLEKTDAYASELLHSPRFAKMAAAELSQSNHGLLTELVMGVLRWRGTLDLEIEKHARQPLPKFDVEVLTAIRMGAYQLMFLDRVPAHAAINESVELAKRSGKRSASGLVNAVLRKLDGEPQTAEFSGSHPSWLVERWERTYGQSGARQICEYDQKAPEVAIRIDGKTILTDDIHLEPGKLLTSAARITRGNISQSTAFREHRLIIQDEGSQLIALLAGHGKMILDCCAAPGGKTRILAEENPDAMVIAMELHPHRAALLRKLVPEANVQVIAGDARTMPLREKFDCILVDSPCSGTGTLARNPEIKWRLKPDDISRLQKYQLEILNAAMKQASAGGTVTYSTCSLEPDENEQVVEKAVAENSDFRVTDARHRLLELQGEGKLAWESADSLLSGPYLRTIPGIHPCDGFFAAILQRK